MRSQSSFSSDSLSVWLNFHFFGQSSEMKALKYRTFASTRELAISALAISETRAIRAGLTSTFSVCSFLSLSIRLMMSLPDSMVILLQPMLWRYFAAPVSLEQETMTLTLSG